MDSLELSNEGILLLQCDLQTPIIQAPSTQPSPPHHPENRTKKVRELVCLEWCVRLVRLERC